MECAECISTGQLCFDCQLRAAREEGRREGYAQATLEMACAPLADEQKVKMDALEAQWREGYAACTADVVAFTGAEPAWGGWEVICRLCRHRHGSDVTCGVRIGNRCNCRGPAPPSPTLAEACEVLEDALSCIRCADCGHPACSNANFVRDARAFLARVKGGGG